ncbi:family 43 glycosylhydrolase, partial [candidate division KSB1 bacterium]|nr:family 43 glycosylhydrolase [candidate division KSB1 bacterium]
MSRKTILILSIFLLSEVYPFTQFHSQELLKNETADSIKLSEIKMRDVCILPDPVSKTYYMIGPDRGNSVRCYTSSDLKNWYGPRIIFTAPTDLWGDISIRGIWAPELHAYQGKYYLFLTFNTQNEFSEQWRNWLPRVTRGSQVLVGDSPFGPFRAFNHHATLPSDMMTLDGTLWIEDNLPYMVYCHEWVQIKDGTIEYIQMTDDLSATVGEPKHILNGSDAPWNRSSPQYHCYVTDGPYLYKSESGKLFMIWSSFSETGYTTGLAISGSGKLSGPWQQQTMPLYRHDGGHGMLFTTFEGALMLVLHSPNNRDAQPRLFELQDTGETLWVDKEFTGTDQRVAPKPLFRDPIYDGAADPAIIWNREEKRWFMLYTNRRANLEGLDGV